MGHYSCLGNSEIKCTLPWQPAMIFSFYLWDSFLQRGVGGGSDKGSSIAATQCFGHGTNTEGCSSQESMRNTDGNW